MNADVYADTAQGVVGTNMFAYCSNNPIRFIDPNGTTETVSVREENITGEAISIFGILVFIVAYLEPIMKILESLQRISYSSTTATKPITQSRTLADTKAKLPNKLERVYQYAYINQYGELIKSYMRYTFLEIIARIGVANRPSHSLWQKYEYSGSSSILNWANMELNGAIDKSDIVWGVYTQKKRICKSIGCCFW